MSVLEGVLLEEISRLERNISSYRQILSNLPRGTIFIKKVGNTSYVYRKRKENGKVVSIYLGIIDDNNVKKEMERSNDYKRIKNNIRIANSELIKLKKAYKTYAK